MALLQKAVSNIIGNAVAHSPSQAEISVTLAGNILQVRNSGVSIDSANLEKIFEPFYRVDRSHNRNTGGSGLGLYIVKTILERHGFSFRMNSTDDEVCFTAIF
jgi:two-component system sensor histidine kinase VanS